MGRRTLLLIAAVLLAAIGTGVLFLYVSATGDSLRGGSRGSGSTVDVVAPTTALAAGTTVDDTVQFQLVRVDRALAERAGMIGKTSALQGLVANQPLAALVPVTSAQFGGAVKQSTNLGLPKDRMAITLEVDDPARVSSFLRPGSRVAVFVVDPESKPREKRHEARLVLTDVVVLTIGTSGTIVNRSTATTGAGANASRGSQSLVTFQVNQRQAGQLLVADAEGDIHLTLLGSETTPTLESFDQEDIRVP